MKYHNVSKFYENACWFRVVEASTLKDYKIDFDANASSNQSPIITRILKKIAEANQMLMTGIFKKILDTFYHLDLVRAWFFLLFLH